MSPVRPQFHFRQTSTGVDAWEVQRLIALSRDLPIISVSLESIAELDRDHWFFHDQSLPTPRALLTHIRLIQACDLQYPIILDAQGCLMDGMHRVCKALLLGHTHIDAVRFATDPSPDYVNCDPAALSKQLAAR